MKRKYGREIFPEDGPVYKIEVGILKDIVTFSRYFRPGLHKTGPSKETLAAALVLMGTPDRLLYDLGSGTIPVEAAMIEEYSSRFKKELSAKNGLV